MYALDADMRAPGFERIVAGDAVLERVSHDLVFTEGPVWDARQAALVWYRHPGRQDPPMVPARDR